MFGVGVKLVFARHGKGLRMTNGTVVCTQYKMYTISIKEEYKSEALKELRIKKYLDIKTLIKKMLHQMVKTW
jgi:DNA-directed RNA polymerase subunit N (RpoN/RPB10)